MRRSRSGNRSGRSRASVGLLFLPVTCLLLAIPLVMGGSAAAAPILWVSDFAGRLGTVDATTGAVTVIGTMGTVMTDIAFDTNQDLYGVSGNLLHSIDPTTAVSTVIGSLGTSVSSLTFSPSGVLYGAQGALFSIDKNTGAATSIGSGGFPYSSSGDLAFVGGNLFLSSAASPGDNLVQLDTNSGVGTLIGAIGFSVVYGLATDNNSDLYGVAGTTVLSIDPLTGASSVNVDYAGQGLGSAFGSAFITEAPEPGTATLLGIGLVGLAGRRRQKFGRRRTLV